MRISGKRIKKRRLIETAKYVVAVDVEMVIPADDPSEPCYESETVEYLKEVKARAEQGDLDWLAKRGKVYAAVASAE
jgi:hypothetical protein